MIHILKNGKFLQLFKPPMEKNERINIQRFHNDGEILILTSSNKLHFYKFINLYQTF